MNENEDESLDVTSRRGSGTDTNNSRRGSGHRGPTLEQLTETLLKKDFENVLLAQEGDTILSDEQLELLLDRSVSFLKILSHRIIFWLFADVTFLVAGGHNAFKDKLD